MTFEKYLDIVTKYGDPEQRVGQRCVNVLHDISPKLCARALLIGPDPFYVDGLVPAFLQTVGEIWDSTEVSD